MRRFGAFSIAVIAASLTCPPRCLAQTATTPAAPPEVTAGQQGCEVYFALQPIDPAALKLLATPIVPLNHSVFADTSIKQLQEWDLPSKVTAWHDRPSAEELARQWDELNKKFSGGAQGKDKSKKETPLGQVAPYSSSPLPPKEWQDFDKWFKKNAPKKLSGACVDSTRAMYVLAVGIVLGGASVLPNGPNRVGQYADYASKPLPESLGPNASKVSPYKTPHDEFTGSGMSDGASGYTCVYLYRTNGKSLAEGGIRQEAPDYYYCHAGGGISQSTVTTMLKYLAKSGLAPAPQH